MGILMSSWKDLCNCLHLMKPIVKYRDDNYKDACGMTISTTFVALLSAGRRWCEKAFNQI